MSDRAWKAFERRMSRDVSTQRIPVTGERHGADGETARFCSQLKLRQTIPGYLIDWLRGIVGAAARPAQRVLFLLWCLSLREKVNLSRSCC
jgi:hypothetical protein